MNQIAVIQNEEAQLRLLRARRQVYDWAVALMYVQLVLTLVIPATFALAAIHWLSMRPFVATLTLVITVIDVTLLDRLQRRLLKRAAKIAEKFDCTVLQLPWDSFTVGRELDPEDIAEAEVTFRRQGKSDKKLLDWYPPAVAEAPIHFARLICQRTNLWYDSKLRRRYATAVFMVAGILVAVLLFAGLAANLALADYLGTVVPPLAPILIWAAREGLRHSDAASLQDDIRTKARDLWMLAKKGGCDPADCEAQSRQFQSGIYTRRAASPLVFPVVYAVMRDSLEEEMNEGAQAQLRELDTGHHSP